MMIPVLGGPEEGGVSWVDEKDSAAMSSEPRPGRRSRTGLDRGQSLPPASNRAKPPILPLSIVVV